MSAARDAPATSGQTLADRPRNLLRLQRSDSPVEHGDQRREILLVSREGVRIERVTT